MITAVVSDDPILAASVIVASSNPYQLAFGLASHARSYMAAIGDLVGLTQDELVEAWRTSRLDTD